MTILLPFNEASQWLRGSLHCHSTNSDGEVPPEQVAARYKAEGYDFICVTDHFRPEFNYPITDLSVFNDDVFLTIPSAELHIMATSYGKLWHLTANGLPGNFQPPMTDETPAQYAQRAADAGAFVSIVHPSWYQLTLEDAETITCAHAVEVWNAGCQIMHSRGDGAYLLDGLLDRGRHLLCTAVDDMHGHLPDFALAWVMVKSLERSQAAILSALKRGAFYSSEGPEIKHMALNGRKLVMHTSAASTILVNGQGYTNAFKTGVNITHTEIDLSDFDSPWFRVIVTARDGRHAWSNPYWFEDIEAQ